jgi:hypothetical protein
MVIGYPGSASTWGGSQLVSQASNLVASATNGRLRVTSGPHSGKAFKLTSALFLYDVTSTYLEGTARVGELGLQSRG